MSAGTESVLVLLVALIAVALVVQAISLLILVLSFRRICIRVEFFLDQISRDVQPVLSSARDLLTEGKEKFHAISTNVLDITTTAKAQAARLDRMLTDASDQARRQLIRLDDMVTDTSEQVRLQFIRLDQLLSDTVSRIEETSEAVRRTIRGPAREASAILAGLRAVLDYLVSRRSKPAVEHATQDEELFI
jgi:uncharacterized protein YoxC